MSDRQWQLRLAEGVSLTGPNDQPVSFKTRKAEALIAYLALRTGQAVPRADVAAAIWPDSSREKALASLRQTVHHIRDACPESEPITANRDSCRLDVDRVEVQIQEGPQFLTEFTEPTFNRWRRQGNPREEISEASRSFAEVLRWALISDPRRVIQLVRSAPELAEAMRADTLSDILSTALANTTPADTLYGWGSYHLGMARSWQGFFFEGLRDLGRSLKHAVEFGDRDLRDESLYCMAQIAPVCGNTDKGIKAALTGRQLARHEGSRDRAAQFEHALGIALRHAGQLEAGSESLAVAKQAGDFGSRLDAGFRAVHRIDFLNAHDQSYAELEEANEIADEFGSWRLAIACRLAEAQVSVLQHDVEGARRRLEAVLAAGGAELAPIMAMTAHECLSLLWRRDDEELAARHRAEAIRIRTRLQLPRSQGERAMRRRIADLTA